MTKTTTQQGFTLVELAIVMTIIGLLIGGILKGQELMLNARVTATIAQVRSYEAAATTFRDSFAAIPGDMPGAAARLPGCTAACDPVAASAGNSIIGSPTWSTGWANQGVPLSDTTVSKETTLFWTHLMAADLISGVSPEVITTPATATQWGITHPAARINGGFVIGYANGAVQQPGLAATAGTNPTGLQLALNSAPNLALNATLPGQNPLTAGKAAQIDRKMDDGRPSSGFVQAYGITASCFTTAALLTYAEGTTGNDCGLLFRIQG